MSHYRGKRKYFDLEKVRSFKEYSVAAATLKAFKNRIFQVCLNLTCHYDYKACDMTWYNDMLY